MIFSVGDIVGIVDAWREPTESKEDRYVVLEDRDTSLLVRYIDVDHKFALCLTYCWDKDYFFNTGINVIENK